MGVFLSVYFCKLSSILDLELDCNVIKVLLDLFFYEETRLANPTEKLGLLEQCWIEENSN